MLSVPDEIEGLPIIASMSGGKDSTALLLALREAQIPHRAVFADTGWEAPETYEYLDLLRARLGLTIDVVGAPGGMVAKIRARAGFPARMQRWCTRELKIDPLRAYHDTVGDNTVSALGIRAAESESRSKMLELEDEPVGPHSWGGWIWRPLLRWSVEDVLGIHARHGIPVNPLYQRGHDRVGCYPCIYAQKEEVRLVAEHAPERIDQIRALEAEVVALRARRNAETPGRYAHAVGTFFQGRFDRRGMTPIDDVVLWSRTTRGGRQLPLLPEPPRGGCMRWGLCDTGPSTERIDDESSAIQHQPVADDPKSCGRRPRARRAGRVRHWRRAQTGDPRRRQPGLGRPVGARRAPADGPGSTGVVGSAAEGCAVKILAIDPGFAELGWAVIDASPRALDVVACGVLRTAKEAKKRKLHSGSDDGRRIEQLALALEQVRGAHGDGGAFRLGAYELPAAAKGARAAHALGLAHAIVRLSLRAACASIVEVTVQDARAAVVNRPNVPPIRRPSEKETHEVLIANYPRLVDATAHELDAVAVGVAALETPVGRALLGKGVA